MFPQITPASSWCRHWLEAPSPWWEQSRIDFSFPVHLTSSNQIVPVPWPKPESPGAACAWGRPSMWQMTVALFKFQLSSQIVPHMPFTAISTLPCVDVFPPASRTSTEIQTNEIVQTHVPESSTIFSSIREIKFREAGMAQWWEHSPPTNVFRVQFPDSIPGPGVICGLSLLLVLSFAPRGFSPGTPVFPSP